MNKKSTTERSEEVTKLMDAVIASTRQSERREAVEQLVSLFEQQIKDLEYCIDHEILGY